MKKTIIKYGLIASAIIAVLMLISTTLLKDIVEIEHSAYIGYTYIVASMSLIFFGVKSYRDKENQGKITFKTALLIGLGIMAIACIAYSLTWLVVYYNFMPNFMNEYIDYYVNKMKSAGSSKAEIDKMLLEMEGYKSWYSNPFSIFVITLAEPLPVGLVFALVAALILKKK